MNITPQPEALARHFAAFEPARDAIGKHDALLAELGEGLRLMVEANRAAEENLFAIHSGADAGETQAALEAALSALVDFRGGRWLALLWFINFKDEVLRETAH